MAFWSKKELEKIEMFQEEISEFPESEYVIYKLANEVGELFRTKLLLTLDCLAPERKGYFAIKWIYGGSNSTPACWVNLKSRNKYWDPIYIDKVSVPYQPITEKLLKAIILKEICKTLMISRDECPTEIVQAVYSAEVDPELYNNNFLRK